MTNIVAVKVALSRAGRVVFVSGVTLGLTNAGLTFCSVDVVASIGWGGTLSCFVAVAVHLTLLPALLIVCGPCLHTFAHKSCRCELFSNLSYCTSDTTLGSESLLPTAGVGAGKFMRGSERVPRRGDSTLPPGLLGSGGPVSKRWVRLGEFCRDHRIAIISAMIGVMIPFGYSTLQYQTSVSGLMLTPRETPALTAMTDITGSPHACLHFAWACGLEV
eukprot:COSAG02_NODE_352_length_24036_cov_20.479258_24_plen_218_part_00